MSAEDQLQYKPTIEEIAEQKRREWIADEIFALKDKFADSGSVDGVDGLNQIAFKAILSICFPGKVEVPRQ
jgi:hypothetical protein